MNTLPKISETEWEIMRIIWATHPVTAAEVIEKLSATDPSWHPKTARTLLSRLVQKKALDCRLESRVYVYTPKVSEQQCVDAVSQSFLERVFGGSLKPMFAHFVERQKLSNKDLDELKQLLEDQAEEKSKQPRRKHGSND